jgi:hypothetical protein
VIGTVGCDAGATCIPENPGTVAEVSDHMGNPIPNVQVTVSEVPNCVGSFYVISVPTNTNGLARIDSIPAGTRRVEVTVPSGFLPDPDGSGRVVEVVRSATVVVRFRLSLQTPTP